MVVRPLAFSWRVNDAFVYLLHKQLPPSKFQSEVKHLAATQLVPNNCGVSSLASF